MRDEHTKGVLGRSALVVVMLLILGDIAQGLLSGVSFREVAEQHINRWIIEVAAALGVGATYNRRK